MKTTIEYKVFYFFEGITFEDLCNKIIPFRDKKQKQTKNKQISKQKKQKKSATTIKSVDEKGSVFLVQLKLQGESIE